MVLALERELALRIPEDSRREKSELTRTGRCIQVVCVRIVRAAFLARAASDYPKGRRYLETWRKVVKMAQWRNLLDVRRTYPNADHVKVKSGRQVIVFNMCGNEYRLIAAIHFDRQIVFTLRFMTHAEYSKDGWKDEL
jgi:mRNA interferase HigB